MANPDDSLPFSQKSRKEFENEVRLPLVVKRYESEQVSTGTAAQLVGMSRVVFIFALARFGLPPVGLEPGEYSKDSRNA